MSVRQSYYQESSRQLLFTIFDASKEQKHEAFRIHHHTELEIGHITGGEGLYLLGSSRYSCRAGDTYLVRSGEQHCVPTVTSPTLDSFNLHITAYWLWNVAADYLEPEKLRALIRSDGKTGNELIRDDPVILERLRVLMELFYRDCEGNRCKIRRAVLDLILAIADSYQPCANEPVRNYAAAHLADIQNAMLYISEHLAEPVTLDDIARASNLSRSHMSALFKEINGISAYEYLLICRLEKAVGMLRGTKEPILSIAHACGFSNLSNFNRLFRKMTGLTPGAYRAYRKNMTSVI